MSRQFKVTVNGREYDVAVQELTPGAPSLTPSTQAYVSAPVQGGQPVTETRASTAVAAPINASANDEVAQMGGVVVQVEVRAGQTVQQGDRLIVMEAMKMKTHVMASKGGQVTRVLVAVGDVVEAGQPLVTLA
jgi:biotin carboxyl carrier protein